MTSMFLFCFFTQHSLVTKVQVKELSKTEKKGEAVEDEARRQGRSFDATFTASLCKQLD